MTEPTFIDWFAGVGGFRLGMEAAGFRCVWSCEIDEACRSVYAARFGHEPEGRDINDVRPEDIPYADVWCGGPPCQNLSVAGKRAGLRGERSGLFFRFVELVAAKRPPVVFLEQVPGLFSSHEGRDMEAWLGALAELGYMGAYWCVDAQFRGVPQRRNRVITLGCARNLRVAEILPFAEGGPGDIEACGEEGEGVAADAGGGAEGAGGQGRRIARGEIARSLGGVGGGQDCGANKGTLVGPETAGAVNADGGANQGQVKGDGKSDCIDGRPGAIAIQEAQTGVRAYEKAGTIRADAPGHQPGGSLIAFQSTGGARDVQAGEKSPSIKVGSGRSIPSPPAVVYENHGQDSRIKEVSVSPQINQKAGTGGNNPPLVQSPMTLRRLTPTETERLQGFEDGHNCTCGVRPDCPDRRVPPWIDPSKVRLGGCGHSACGCKCPDSARYRQMGNAVAVPVVHWIAKRLRGVIEEGR